MRILTRHADKARTEMAAAQRIIGRRCAADLPRRGLVGTSLTSAEVEAARAGDGPMSESGTSASSADTETPPFALDADEVVAAAGSDTDSGLTGAQVASRLAAVGPNAIAAERPPSVWAVAASQLRDPMNIMLVAVVVVSLAIGQVSTGVLVGLLIVLNVVLGTRQELTARASVDALAKMQVPQARVVRDGSVALVPALDVVPGDIVQVEAGDIVPADGRIIHSAMLETQEAALTGESAPIGKSATTLAGAEVALG